MDDHLPLAEFVVCSRQLLVDSVKLLCVIMCWKISALILIQRSLLAHIDGMVVS